MNKAQIKQQVDYYFSLDNYPYDDVLKNSADANGYVPLEILLKFNRIRMLANDVTVIAASLVGSDVVEVSQDGTKLRRKDPVPPNFEQLLIKRSIAVLGIPEGVSHESIRDLFNNRGYFVTSVKMRVSERNAAVAFSDPNMAQNAVKEDCGDMKAMLLSEYHSMKRGQTQRTPALPNQKVTRTPIEYDSFLTLKNARGLSLPFIAKTIRESFEVKVGIGEFCRDEDTIRLPMFESDVKKMLEKRPMIVVLRRRLIYMDEKEKSKPESSRKAGKQEKQKHTAPFPTALRRSRPPIEYDSFLTLKNARGLSLPFIAKNIRESFEVKVGIGEFCRDEDTIRLPMFESDVQKMLKKRPTIVVLRRRLIYMDEKEKSKPESSRKAGKQEKQKRTALAPFPSDSVPSAPENPMRLNEFIGLVREHVEPLLISLANKVLDEDTAETKLWSMRPDFVRESQYNPYDIRNLLKLIRFNWTSFQNSFESGIQESTISELIELFNVDAHSKPTTTEEARARGYALFRMVKEMPSIGIDDPDGVSTIIYSALQRLYVGSERINHMNVYGGSSKPQTNTSKRAGEFQIKKRYLFLSNSKGISILSITQLLQSMYNVKVISAEFMPEAANEDVVRVTLSASEYYRLSSMIGSIKVGERKLPFIKKSKIAVKPGSVVWFPVIDDIELLSGTVSSLIGSDVAFEVLKSGRGVRIDCGTEEKANQVRVAGKLDIDGQVVSMLNSKELCAVFLEGFSGSISHGDLLQAYMRHGIELENVIFNDDSARLITSSADDAERVLALGKIDLNGIKFSGPYSYIGTLILYPVPESLGINDVQAALKSCIGSLESIEYFSAAVDEVITMRLSSEEHLRRLLKQSFLNVNGHEIRIAKRRAKSVNDCVFGEYCRDFECGSAHPPNRAPLCHEIHCRKPWCSSMHPTPGPVDYVSLESRLLMFRFEKHHIWNNIMKLMEVRSNHMVKIEAASSAAENFDLKIMSAFGRDRDKLVSTREAHMATVDELISQMKCFDDALVSALGSYRSLDSLSERIAREIFRLDNCLPALSKRNDFVKLVKDRERFIIVHGKTGSGKSTQLPQYLIDIDKLGTPLVICTQPRKMAAIALAERVGFEYSAGKRRGDDWSQVGYAVGLDYKIKASTRLIYASESEFLKQILEYDESKDERELKTDRFCFSRVNFLVIDEAHERSINTDLLLGIFRNPPKHLKHIQVIITSATLDASLFCDFFRSGDCPAPLLDIPGRLFPVDIQYVDEGFQSNNLVQNVIDEVLRLHRNGTEGDILCFLPSKGEVNIATSNAQLKFGDNALCIPLYGQMERREQSRVFARSDRPKIIFSTNVAETSVTIDGIRVVIDSGLCKEMVYDGNSGISALRLTPISKSSAIQRAGRAGRTSAGICIRLYSRNDFESWPVAGTSDIGSMPLTSIVLKLAAFNIRASSFPWIEAPPADAIMKAEETLLSMDAIHIEDDVLNLSRIGEVASRLELEPSHAMAILKGCFLGIGESAILICAVDTFSSNFYRRESDGNREMAQENVGDGDLIGMFKKFNEYQEVSGSSSSKISDEWLKRNRMWKSSIGNVRNFVSNTRQRIDRYRLSEWRGAGQRGSASPDQLQFLASICCFPNVGVLMGNNGQYITPSGGLIASLSYSSVLRSSENLPEMIVFGQFVEIGGRNLCDTATPTTMAILKQVSLTLHDDLLKKRESWPTREVVVKNISPAISSRLIGKRRVHQRRLENKLHCNIQFDPLIGRLSFFTTDSEYEEKRCLIHAMVDDLRHSLRAELKEEKVCGETHGLFGAGCIVDKLLFFGDSVSVRLNGLPSRIDVSEIARALKQRMKVQPCDIEVAPAGGMALLTFEEVRHAKEAVDILKGEYVFEDKMLSAELGKLLTENTEPAVVGGMLQMTYSNAPSSGKARVVFSSAHDANELLEKHGATFNGLYAGSGKCYPYGKGIDKYDEKIALSSYTVFVHGILPNVDEEDLQLRLHTNNLDSNVISVFVYRESKDEGNSDPLFVQVSHLRSLIPFKEKIVSQTSFADNSRLRGSITVFYEDIHTCRDALDVAKKLEIEPLFGQPVRFKVQYQYRQVLHDSVYLCLRNGIEKLLREGKGHGAQCFVEGRDRGLKVVKLSSSSTQVLNLLKEKLVAILKADSSFDHLHKELLFSRYARSQMQAIPSSEGHIHWVNASHRIHVYGSNMQKNAMKDKLAKLADELSHLEIDKCIRLTHKSKNSIDPCEMKENFELLGATKLGQNLLVTGTKENVASLMESLKKSRSIFRIKGFRSASECSMCGDTNPNTSLSICGHRYCRECIEPMFEQTDVPLPFRCPSLEGCGEMVSWSDVLALSDSSSVAKIKEKAVVLHAREHPNEIVSCPMNCGQYFPTTPGLTRDQQRELGGRLVHCDQCLQSWCLECSLDNADAAPQHTGYSCEEQRRFMNPDIAGIVEEIRVKILTLHCASCDAAFLDFSGCTSLECWSCKRWFCGWCLVDCGNDAHPHVRQCSLNAKPGEYFASFELWNDFHKNQKRIAVIERIRLIGIRKKQFDVLEALKVDLVDLGIEIKDSDI